MYSVRIIVAGRTGPHPDYDPKQPVSAENPFSRTIEVGEIVEGPLAWHLCLPEAGSEIVIAEPADEITESKVAAETENRLNRLRSQARKGHADAARQLKEVYDEEPPEPVEKPETDKPKTGRRRRRKSTA